MGIAHPTKIINMTDTKGADAIDRAIAQGVDLDDSPIPANKLALYNKVMGFEAGRQRSGVTNTMGAEGYAECNRVLSELVRSIYLKMNSIGCC